jgi:hypothetical protein
METFSTTYSVAGWWTPAPTAGWFTNASVTPTTSAVIYGSGTGTSANEQDWYVLPNVTGLDNTHQYQLRFRLASYTFSNSTATSRGVDVADIVDVQVSTNGGVSYVSELRITGNSNARWDYTATGTITHTANGTFTNSAAPVGDVYQSPAGVTTAGPSTIALNLPANITQVAIDIFCRVNSAGEEWWLDNIELWDMTPTPLPIELVSFEGERVGTSNVIKWQTASEHNTDYYLVKRMNETESGYSVVGTIGAAGNSNQLISYSFSDFDHREGINYYVLVQFDNDGKFEEFGPIAIFGKRSAKILKIVNLMGQEVGEGYSGVMIVIYEDGSSEKVFK